MRGPWICSDYFKLEGSAGSHTEDGWFDTGDVATIDPHGYMAITDRTKDVIKSGGEWISSIELENTGAVRLEELVLSADMAESIELADKNWLAPERPARLPLIDGLDPAEGYQGETLTVTFTGNDLGSASALVSASPHISGSLVQIDQTTVTATVEIAPEATPGKTTLGLVTSGGTSAVAFAVLGRELRVSPLPLAILIVSSAITP